MACVHGKVTAFGRIHDYRVCRVFQQSGKTRCDLNGDSSCPSFIDDGKYVEAAPHSVEDLRYLEMCDRIQKCLVAERVRRFSQELAPFFDGALAQSPDGGADYYEHENPLLPDCSTWADDLARIAYRR